MRTQIAAVALTAATSIVALAPPATAGLQMAPDCNGDGIVGLNEIVIVVHIAQGEATRLSRSAPPPTSTATAR